MCFVDVGNRQIWLMYRKYKQVLKLLSPQNIQNLPTPSVLEVTKVQNVSTDYGGNAGTKPTYFFPSQVPRFHWSLVTLFPEVGGVVVPILGDQHHLWLLGVFSTTNGCQSFDLIVTDTTWNSFNIPTLDVFSASLRFRRWDQGYTFGRNASAWGIRLPLFCGCGRSASPGIEGIWKVITKKPWASKTYHFSDFPWRKNDTFSFNPPFKKGLISLRSSEISSYSTNEDRDCLKINPPLVGNRYQPLS